MGKVRRRRAAKAKAPYAMGNVRSATRQKKKERARRGGVGTKYAMVPESDVIGAVLSENWDKTKSLEENYAALGLSTDPNKGVNSNTTAREGAGAGVVVGERVIGEDERGKLVVVEDESESEEEMHNDSDSNSDSDNGKKKKKAVSKLSKKAAAAMEKAKRESKIRGAARKLQLKPAEKAAIAKLIAKHGEDDYVAMARDMRLNPYQRTPKELERWSKAFLASSASSKSNSRKQK